MDSHPDFTLTRSVYGAQFGRAPAAFGGGFKNFRPLRIANGRIFIAQNNQIADYSTQQFFGTESPDPNRDWRQAKFAYGGIAMGYYEYVRTAMAGGKLEYNPVAELKFTMRTLCNELYNRRRFVEMAIAAGIDRKAHPDLLPPNIYGTEFAEWEIYSTPSRDARLKTAFKAFRDDTSRLVEFWLARDERIAYDGLDLREDPQKAYDNIADVCSISYLNGANKIVRLHYSELAARLFRLSYDPYDCIERRWGEHSPEALSSCRNSAGKERWYEAQQRLRNQVERTYDLRMDFTLKELEAKAPGSGVDTAPDIDTKIVIASIGARTALPPMKPIPFAPEFAPPSPLPGEAYGRP